MYIRFESIGILITLFNLIVGFVNAYFYGRNKNKISLIAALFSGISVGLSIILSYRG